MKRFFTLTGLSAVAALLLVPVALATSHPVVPDVPVAAYGNTLLTELGGAIADVLPYAAAITAFAIAVGMIRRWLGARKATRV